MTFFLRLPSHSSPSSFCGSFCNLLTLIRGKAFCSSLSSFETACAPKSDGMGVLPLVWVHVLGVTSRNVRYQLCKLVRVTGSLRFFGGVCHAANIARARTRPNRALNFLGLKLRHYRNWRRLDKGGVQASMRTSCVRSPQNCFTHPAPCSQDGSPGLGGLTPGRGSGIFPHRTFFLT